MSADYWLEIKIPALPEPIRLCENLNVTYNLGPMLRAAGFPPWQALIGAPASETGGMLAGVRDELIRAPDKYRNYNPTNGWGTYEAALGFVARFAEECALNPEATVGGWL